jgi:cephalosporin hydroxylase
MSHNLQHYIDTYEDTEECNGKIILDFVEGTNSVPWLKAHRDFIEEYYKRGIIYGHGDRCLQYMWKLIVDTLPNSFMFLEIGVYKGQILSLMQIIADKTGKEAKIVGVTPLFDKPFANYNRLPYIERIYKKFNASMENTLILDGLSQDPKIIEKVYEQGLYDAVYVDGDHSYKSTVEDIENFSKCLKVGGYMIVDDASNYKNIPPSVRDFKGLVDVSNAVRDTLENNSSYEELMTCMHVRIFRKIG